jgi:hypothetical protein
MASMGCTEEEAATISQEESKGIRELVTALLEKHRFENIHFFPYRHYLNDPRFSEAKKAFQETFNVHSDLSESLNRSASLYVHRQKKKGMVFAVSRQQARALARAYILEELCVFMLLVQDGYRIEIYPGSEIDCLKKIAILKPKTLPSFFYERINVEIALEEKELIG